MSKPIHIALTEDDFAGLVRGEIVTTIGNGQIVKIVLSDIGFDRMLVAIDNAVMEQRYPNNANSR